MNYGNADTDSFHSVRLKTKISSVSGAVELPSAACIQYFFNISGSFSLPELPCIVFGNHTISSVFNKNLSLLSDKMFHLWLALFSFIKKFSFLFDFAIIRKQRLDPQTIKVREKPLNR